MTSNYGDFYALREEARRQVKVDLAARIANNPVPTPDELRIGIFIELLEPQVREAVFLLNRKGYRTFMSGFWGENSDIQRIDGMFKISRQNKKTLEALGVIIRRHVDPPFFPGQKRNRVTSMEFCCCTPDLKAMTTLWSEIAGLIKDRKRPVAKSEGLGAALFRYRFAGAKLNPVRIERLITALEKSGMRLHGKTPQESFVGYRIVLEKVRKNQRDFDPFTIFLDHP